MALIQHSTNPISDKLLGAAIEVHRHLGAGLLESTYHTCLCRELELREIGYQSQVALAINYKGIEVARGYVIDFLIEDSLIVEIKSVDKLLPIHSSQLLTYLRLQRVSSGLLINFNVPTLPPGHLKTPALVCCSVHLPCTPCFRGVVIAEEDPSASGPA